MHHADEAGHRIVQWHVRQLLGRTACGVRARTPSRALDPIQTDWCPPRPSPLTRAAAVTSEASVSMLVMRSRVP